MGMGASPTNPLPKDSLDEVIAATKLLAQVKATPSFSLLPRKRVIPILVFLPGHYAIMRVLW